MEIKDMKTKVKIVLPEESEIFMAEEFLESLHEVSLKEKPVELDFSSVQSLDTVFFKLAAGIIKSVNENNNKITIKTSEILENAEMLYGIKLESLIDGGGN